MADSKDDVHEATALPEEMRDPGFWKELWNQVRLVFTLLRDVLFPLDFAPDFWPVLGQLDDLTALLVGAKVFIEMAPPQVVARHMSIMYGSHEGDDAEEKDPLEDAIIVDADHELIGDKPRRKMKD